MLVFQVTLREIYRRIVGWCVNTQMVNVVFPATPLTHKFAYFDLSESVAWRNREKLRYQHP